MNLLNILLWNRYKKVFEQSIKEIEKNSLIFYLQNNKKSEKNKGIECSLYYKDIFNLKIFWKKKSDLFILHMRYCCHTYPLHQMLFWIMSSRHMKFLTKCNHISAVNYKYLLYLNEYENLSLFLSINFSRNLKMKIEVGILDFFSKLM